MTRLRNMNLDVFIQASTQEPLQEAKIWDRVCLMKLAQIMGSF